MSQPQNIGDVIETRRRSRSKTPSMNLRISSDRELNGSETSPGRKVRKTPTVGMIEEEVAPSPAAQKSAAASQGRSTPVRKTRIVTSDYSSEDVSPDRARQAATAVAANAQLAKSMGQLTQSSITTTTTTMTTTEQTTVVLDSGKEKVTSMQTVTQTSNSGGKANEKTITGKEVLSTSPKKDTSSQKSMSTTTTTSSSSSATNTRSSKLSAASAAVIRTSTPKNAAQKMPSAKVILTPEELQQHAAYKEYLEAGEYWNKYPKTDYTYSELSPHRREVAPGLVAMPNMSRPSLNKHAERVQTMIQRNPEQEAFIRERYTSARSRLIRSNPYDSNDETDELMHSTSVHRQQQQRVTIEQRSIISRLLLSITTFFFTCFDSVRNVFSRQDEQHMYYTRIEDERGTCWNSVLESFFSRVYGFVSSFFVNVFKRIYLLISSVLFLDAWLLQTSAANTEQQQLGQRKRRLLLFLLVLLPFLVIGDPSALETIRASFPSELPNLPELKLPNLPNLPDLPDMPSVPIPDVESVKQYVGDRWTDMSDMTGYYFDQLKLVSQNSANATIVLPASSRATLALSSLSRILPSNIKDTEVDIETFYRYVNERNENFRERVHSVSSFLSTLSLPFGWLSISSFSWPWPWTGGKSDTASRETIRNTLQRTLSKEEFEELMRHIDAYIDGMMEQKYVSKAEETERLKKTSESSPKETITPELTVHVAHVIEESLKSYNYHLADSDVDAVVEKVRQTLQNTYPSIFEEVSKKESSQTNVTPEGGNVVLSKEYITEVQRLVEQQMTVHNHHYVISGPQLEDILARILSSEKLGALIDQRIVVNSMAQSQDRAAVDQRQRESLVDDLRKELNDIKVHFSEQLLSSSVKWEERLQLVKQNHKQLEEQLKAYRLESNELYQKLLADIDNRLNALREERYEGVNKVIRENIITILGLNVKQDIADGDLRAWINGLFVARDHLEQRLEEIQSKVKLDVREEIDRSAGRLMQEIGEQILAEMMVKWKEEMMEREKETATGHTTVATSESKVSSNGGTDDPDAAAKATSSNLTEDDVKRIVRDALTVYDADKTGKVDYALESAGGQVLSTRCTESYQASSAEFRIFGIIPIWYPSNTPRTVISPTMEPGQCWAFQGFPGYLVIQLNTEIIVTGFTLEHISKLLVSNGSISSAPKHFTVWGLVALNDPEPVLLGSYEYLDKMGSSVQYFPVQNKDWNQPLQIVELRIESNHGNIHYTCLYRFRVHGEKV
uniref:SUN domain-containing protein n=1 Tax=Anopheles christyi TaxID=43041 RepID=A0A182JXE7_9DIPT